MVAFCNPGSPKDAWSFSHRVNGDKWPCWTPCEIWHFRLATFSLMHMSQLALRHLPEELFLVGRMKWYQICLSYLSYYFVGNERGGCRIPFLRTLWTDSFLECQQVEGATWEKREIRPPLQCSASLIYCPVKEQPLLFSLGLSFLKHRNLSSQWTDAVYSSRETVTYPEQARMIS